MTPEIKISDLSVVLIGSFIPSIYHPSWFSKHKLMAESEATAATVDVVHPEVTNFHTDWLTINVTDSRFMALCSRDDSIPLLRDLVVGTFGLFAESPVRALGINRQIHFQMPSQAAWHALGDKLAPKEPWADVLTSPGMLGVNMQGHRTDAYKGSMNVQVQPSAKIQHGLFVAVNDHLDLMKDKVPGTGSDATNILKAIWQDSLDRIEKIAKTIASV